VIARGNFACDGITISPAPLTSNRRTGLVVRTPLPHAITDGEAISRRFFDNDGPADHKAQ
jgi:hypothetical protein